jgi:hypothetical protein
VPVPGKLAAIPAVPGVGVRGLANNRHAATTVTVLTTRRAHSDTCDQKFELNWSCCYCIHYQKSSQRHLWSKIWTIYSLPEELTATPVIRNLNYTEAAATVFTTRRAHSDTCNHKFELLKLLLLYSLIEELSATPAIKNLNYITTVSATAPQQWPLRQQLDIPTGTKCTLFQLLNFRTIWGHCTVEFDASERLTAFGARTFLVFSHQKWISRYTGT